ncbi:M15 family metallopeptidase [Lysobacter sp. CA196]|uniref:M15 family metallopeptidase n=1 Tax=Lysobacter sp. CA196 TaxID=3455606 RepID=UPI003F8CFB7A
MDSVNGVSHSSESQSTASATEAQTAPSISEEREEEIRTELAQNPQAVAALDQLVADRNFAQLSEEQKVESLNSFMSAPNAATATYLQGTAEVSLNPQATPSSLTPDAGTLTLDGVTYSIEQGNLLDAQGQTVGTIRNDGSVQLASEATARSVYDNISTRVQLTEQVGAQTRTLVDLHAADPRGRLADPNLNQEVANRVTAVIEQARREGMNMRVDTAYRTFAEQDALYAQGRTAPGNRVTNARAGQSWHNYGVAVDLVFNNANGQPSWAETNNWDRYGEIAVAQGLEWGGNWQGLVDRPHVEYHPGFDAGDARNMVQSHRQGGLEAVWDRMGIGQIP